MFGWERFLTERDRELDKTWAKKELFGFGKKPALVLVDIYYAAVGDERLEIFESIKKWPYSTGLEGWAAIDRTVELLAAAREKGIPVVHIKPMANNGVAVRKHASRKGPQLAPELVAKGREIVAEVAPIPGEAVIEKSAPSAFQGTPLMYHLNALGIDTVIFCGESTSGCIRASVVDAAAARYKVSVVQECVFDRTEASHYISLYDIHQKYGDVVSLQAAKGYLRSL